MELSFLYFIEFLIILIPLELTSDNIIRGFWIIFWIFINSSFIFDPLAPDLSIIINTYHTMTFAIISYYSFILTTILLILGIFYWPKLNYYNRYKGNNKIKLMFAIQFISMLYQLAYFSELSYFPQEFYYIINLLPLICCFLNILTGKYFADDSHPLILLEL